MASGAALLFGEWARDEMILSHYFTVEVSHVRAKVPRSDNQEDYPNSQQGIRSMESIGSVVVNHHGSLP
jgi:hypothetical protein